MLHQTASTFRRRAVFPTFWISEQVRTRERANGRVRRRRFSIRTLAVSPSASAVHIGVRQLPIADCIECDTPFHGYIQRRILFHRVVAVGRNTRSPQTFACIAAFASRCTCFAFNTDNGVWRRPNRGFLARRTHRIRSYLYLKTTHNRVH